MSQTNIEESLEILEKQGWDMDALLKDFMRGTVSTVDSPIEVGGVVFHIPYLAAHKKYVLWKCFWPDCHNCCERQGRLPLTSDDLITIGAGLKYSKTSEFIKNETLVATWSEPPSAGQREIVMTSVNLKRKEDETTEDDGTHVKCRFLDDKGGCSMHPSRPGVCYLYPFSTWLVNKSGNAKVHAAYQITGDCPGFYLADKPEQMYDEGVFDDYAKIIYNYNMSSNRTMREGFGSADML